MEPQRTMEVRQHGAEQSPVIGMERARLVGENLNPRGCGAVRLQLRPILQDLAGNVGDGRSCVWKELCFRRLVSG